MENGELDREEKYKTNIEYWETGNLKRICGLYFDPTENTWIKHSAYCEFNKNNLVPHTAKEYRNGELVNRE